MSIKRHTTVSYIRQNNSLESVHRSVVKPYEHYGRIESDADNFPGEDSGVELKIEPGEIKEEKTVPPLKGTTFLVEDLFITHQRG